MKKLSAALIFAVALACLPGISQAQVILKTAPGVGETDLDATPQGVIDNARARVASGDLSGAIARLSLFVSQHPGSVAPARLLGDLYYRQGKLSNAESVYKSILFYNPNDREAHNRLGAVYATQNRIDEAISEYTKSLPALDSIADLVRLHIRKGDVAAYRAGLERDAANYPSQADLQGAVGTAYEVQHDYANALKFFLKELDIAPRSVSALNHAGLAYLDIGNYEKAFSVLNQCVGLQPTNYACTVNLAATYLEIHDYTHGKAFLDRAQALEPEHPEINVNYGYLSDALGNWKQAITYYVKALTISPLSRDAYLNLGVVYEAHQYYELAESALLKGLSVAPTDGALHYLLGRAYEDQKKYDLAVRQFRAAFASDDPQASFLARSRISQLGGTPATH
ncbi:MAG: tetratricopeptide repeat protein [Candidatus Eremiobacteraeota bacterium]|nr:tetratricopeptide repeat protein [Candidatus Eremiobacteraeota bacterium]